MIIKICGMRNSKNIQQLEKSGIATWMGMIFFPKSPRYVSEIPSYLPTKMQRIGVFVNPSFEDIKGRLRSYGLNGIQLHGQETPEFIRQLKLSIDEALQETNTMTVFTSAFNALPECTASTKPIGKSAVSSTEKIQSPIIIKAFNIATAEDLGQTADYEGLCDYFLFDTKCPTAGGSGRKFDWSVLQAYKGHTPFLLSGGIGPDSLPLLQKFHHPQWAGIDLNSCFEITPAVKNIAQLTQFCNEFKALYHE